MSEVWSVRHPKRSGFKCCYPSGCDIYSHKTPLQNTLTYIREKGWCSTGNARVWECMQAVLAFYTALPLDFTRPTHNTTLHTTSIRYTHHMFKSSNQPGYRVVKTKRTSSRGSRIMTTKKSFLFFSSAAGAFILFFGVLALVSSSSIAHAVDNPTVVAILMRRKKRKEAAPAPWFMFKYTGDVQIRLRRCLRIGMRMMGGQH